MLKLGFNLYARLGRAQLGRNSEISVLVVLVALLVFFLWRRCTRYDEKKHRNPSLPLPAIRALAVVFTPTSGGWPSHLATHFFKARVSQFTSSACCLELEISELWEHIYTGDIELRDSADMAEVLRGKLKIYGWKLKFHVDRTCRLAVAQWLAGHAFAGPSRKVRFPAPTNTYDLDFISYQHLNQELLRIQRIHSPGSTLHIEFSTLASGISFLSDDFVLCSMPFMRSCHTNSKNCRTSTPLFLSLHNVVAALSTGYGSIEQISNISLEHASLQLKHVKELAEDRKLRIRQINEVGEFRWREKRFVLIWEAGLLSAGLLMRWRITLKIQNK